MLGDAPAAGAHKRGRGTRPCPIRFAGSGLLGQRRGATALDFLTSQTNSYDSASRLVIFPSYCNMLARLMRTCPEAR
ncbi:hypothetical protein SAMN05216387_10647 [Nitrosovibrio tenuis]|uniref:Uncharacterized protein n=1 Tax=Nitrosovibrio tenuis TaxID=1233 RepID=A0A1H7N4X4_9PROT|nr:hypothetical protein SAMN05216387_10647 [Nitrosovibrio tenuis]